MKQIKKNTVIVTEGEFDAKILSKLFTSKKYHNNLQILPASGFSAALSKVKTILSSRDTNVLLILDTDTITENEISEKTNFVNYYLNSEFYRDRFKVIWAIPEFEIIFLNNKKFLKELTNSQVNEDLIEIGKISPKKTLEKISNKNYDTFLSYIDKKEINDEFHKDELIMNIESFLEQ